MPFTAAHPAIVLPFMRLKSRWVSVTGLVVGSIAPDFAYFIPYYNFSKLSHSLKGLLYFNLPMAFALAIVFHVLLREQIKQQLPEYLRKRAVAVKPVSIGSYLLRNAPVFIVSALIGSFSHLFWDSFTHQTGYFVRNGQFLQQFVSIGFMELPLARVVQHTSTLVGFALLAWHISTLPSAEVKPRTMFAWLPYWVLVGFIGAVVMLLNLPGRFRLNNLEYLVVPFLAGCLLAILLLGILYSLQRVIKKLRS